MEVKKIIAIDDDIDYLKTLENFFRPFTNQYVLAKTFSDVSNDDQVLDMIDAISLLKPHVVLMDYSFLIVKRPDDFGLELTRRILKKCPATKVIMLVGDEDDSDEQRTNKLWRSFTAGAWAYLTKSEPTHWLTGISEALRDEIFIDPPTRKALPKPGGNTFGLTMREIEVLKHLGDDKIVKEIADEMKNTDGKSLAVHGVNFHIKNIKVKMKAHTLHGIVAKACRAGII